MQRDDLRLDEARRRSMLATAVVAIVADRKVSDQGATYRSLDGLSKQHSSGGKDRLGSISKQGDR